MEEKAIEETILKIKQQIAEISKKADEVELKDKAQNIKDKTLEALEKVIAKLKELYNEKMSSEELKEVLSFVENKANGLTNRAKESLENLKNKKISDSGVTIGDYASATVEKITEVCNNATKSVKDYFARKDVQEKIKNFKDTVADAADNIVQAIKKLLNK